MNTVAKAAPDGRTLLFSPSGNIVISPSLLAVAVGFSAAVGIVFGVWPARQAAVLDPIAALRYE